jgi:hypothetical protein
MNERSMKQRMTKREMPTLRLNYSARNVNLPQRISLVTRNYLNTTIKAGGAQT